MANGDRLISGIIGIFAVGIGAALFFNQAMGCTLATLLCDDARIIYTAIGLSLCFFGLFFLISAINERLALTLILLRTSFFVSFGVAFLLIPILRPTEIASRVNLRSGDASLVQSAQSGSRVGVVVYLTSGIIMTIVGVGMAVNDIYNNRRRRQAKGAAKPYGDAGSSAP